METRRAHLIVGGFPKGTHAGHDMEYARLRLLTLLWERADTVATVAGDYSDLDRWLSGARLLITYVAGPYPDGAQNQALRDWLEGGGRWLALHGTAGGRAARSEDRKTRRMVKTEHHATLGGFFINHPPTRRFRVDIADPDDPLTRGLPASFEVVDEPYMVELQDPGATQVLLTAAIGPDTSPPGFGFAYDEDTALLPDGKTRVLAYRRTVGQGGVTYVALGHCHSPLSRNRTPVDTSVDPAGAPPAVLRGPWETTAYQQLLRNAITWGVGGDGP